MHGTYIHPYTSKPKVGDSVCTGWHDDTIELLWALDLPQLCPTKGVGRSAGVEWCAGKEAAITSHSQSELWSGIENVECVAYNLTRPYSTASWGSMEDIWRIDLLWQLKCSN